MDTRDFIIIGGAAVAVWFMFLRSPGAPSVTGVGGGMSAQPASANPAGASSMNTTAAQNSQIGVSSLRGILGSLGASFSGVHTVSAVPPVPAGQPNPAQFTQAARSALALLGASQPQVSRPNTIYSTTTGVAPAHGTQPRPQVGYTTTVRGVFG